MISVSETKFGPVVFRGDLNKNIIKAASIGYDEVELAIRKPEVLKSSEINKLIQKHNVEVIAIGTGQIYSEEGLNFSDQNKHIRKSAIDRTKKIIDVAGHFKARIIIGLIRGNITDWDNYSSKLIEAEERIAKCLIELLRYSEEKSVEFLLEPINRYEINIFNCLEDVSNFLLKYRDMLDLKRVGILADTFHMNIEEPIIEESFEKYFDHIKHIHFADSNRWPPGYGHIDYRKIMNVLKSRGYKDYISFEMLPIPDPDTAANKAIRYIKKL